VTWLIDDSLRYHLRTNIELLTGNEFQAFASKMYHLKFKDNFVAPRGTRDRGCDGIIMQDTIIAAYGPDRFEETSFRIKVNEDYKKYAAGWQGQYPKWVFVCNKEVSAKMIGEVQALGEQVEIVTLNEIVELVESMRHTDIWAIAEYLHIQERYYKYDILKTVISDMMKTNQELTRSHSTRPPYIEDKIAKNYDNQQDIDSAKENYYNCLSQFKELNLILGAYRDEEVSALKSRIVEAYGSYKGTHKKRFELLRKSYALDGNDLYNFYVTVILTYCFEICLIGQRVGGEDASRT